MARKTKDEAEQTRARILDAAEQEMLQRGVGKASLERIARGAEVTRGAIYWHFEDKSALLEAMVARTKMPLRDLHRCLSEHHPDAAPLNLLREMILHSVDRLATDEQHRRVCHIVLHRCEIDEAAAASSRLMSAMFDDARQVLTSICSEIAAECQIAPLLTPDDAGEMILTYIVGLYECSLRYPDSFEVGRQAGARIDVLLHSLFPGA